MAEEEKPKDVTEEEEIPRAPSGLLGKKPPPGFDPHAQPLEPPAPEPKEPEPKE